MTDLSPREVVTQPCRLAFPSLFKKRQRFPGSDRETFQAVVLIPPDADLTPFKKAVAAAMNEKWGKIVPLRGDKIPLRNCEDKASAGYEDGWYYINTHSGTGRRRRSTAQADSRRRARDGERSRSDPPRRRAYLRRLLVPLPLDRVRVGPPERG